MDPVLIWAFKRTIRPQWTVDHFRNGRAGEVLKAKIEFVEDPSSRESSTRIIQLEGSFVSEGSAKEWSGIAQDVTEASQLQAALIQERARSEASAKLVSLGEMAGGIAHEINNPMTIIQAMTEVLESTPVAPEAQAGFIANLNKIQKTVVRITRIVSALRMVSRDGTREPMKIAQLNALIEDSLSLCAEKFRSNGVEVVVDTTTSATIRCNAVQVAQVMVNLLNNAFDSIRMNPNRQDKKETSDKITIAMALEGASVKVTIADTGPGVPTVIRARIFEPFFTTKPIGEGTGLGLSLSASIIKEHGGTMKLLETPVGQGATFELSFPHAVS